MALITILAFKSAQLTVDATETDHTGMYGEAANLAK